MADKKPKDQSKSKSSSKNNQIFFETHKVSSAKIVASKDDNYASKNLFTSLLKEDQSSKKEDKDKEVKYIHEMADLLYYLMNAQSYDRQTLEERESLEFSRLEHEKIQYPESLDFLMASINDLSSLENSKLKDGPTMAAAVKLLKTFCITTAKTLLETNKFLIRTLSVMRSEYIRNTNFKQNLIASFRERIQKSLITGKLSQLQKAQLMEVLDKSEEDPSLFWEALLIHQDFLAENVSKEKVSKVSKDLATSQKDFKDMFAKVTALHSDLSALDSAMQNYRYAGSPEEKLVNKKNVKMNTISPFSDPLEKDTNSALVDKEIRCAFTYLFSAIHSEITKRRKQENMFWLESPYTEFVRWYKPDDLNLFFKELKFCQDCDTPLHSASICSKNPFRMLSIQTALNKSGTKVYQANKDLAQKGSYDTIMSQGDKDEDFLVVDSFSQSSIKIGVSGNDKDSVSFLDQHQEKTKEIFKVPALQSFPSHLFREPITSKLEVKEEQQKK